MEFKKLEKLNKLAERIKEIDNFLNASDRVWRGKLTLKDRVMKLINDPYHVCRAECDLGEDEKLRDKILEIVKEHRKELVEEYKECSKELF